ncbi:hypothetical protein [Paractinoplanes rishiriensis]|uniref:Uncharacterized protein n=1 Tax=Paractinoplanes rishiriensis TaxID=1050105 RepID=A0A919K0P7_9ACTN|nr:hypothetical protein [Actinoplanes rishiriensis]GIE96513.1 hypothetical protein Ari01nite_39780 [Actinoplanes rishiriensis]
MPESRPIDLTPPPESVVEFGAADDRPRRRWSTSGFGRNLVADRRLVPVAAALGAVALVASLVSEWQVTMVDASLDGVGDRMLPTDVTDLGALGSAYLTGLFALVATVVLTMSGPPAGRRYVRLAGLSVGGTLLGVLFALAASLGNRSRVVPQIYLLQLDDDEFSIGYGRGLWCAFAGVTLAVLALYVADKHLPGEDPGEPDDDEEATAIWTWRRPPAEEPAASDQPLELTVAPAKPFTSSSEDRDKPS